MPPTTVVNFPSRGPRSTKPDPDRPRVYLSECGCVRVETRHLRLSYTPQEFLALMRGK